MTTSDSLRKFATGRRRQREILAVVPALLAFHSVALAECPVPEDGAVFVRVDSGALLVDTSATGIVAVEASTTSNAPVEIQERCLDDRVEIEGRVPDRVYAPLDWRIRVPRTVDLDLVTFAGTIRIASTDGSVTARTTGGSVIAGGIGGDAAMMTQGGSILAGDIDGHAELRSAGGGQIEIGDVGGNAELETMAGPITTGTVAGRVRAETNGGAIRIAESIGPMDAVTLAGDIRIGVSSLTRVQTAGGNIIAGRVRGPFVGSTELGDLRIERAESFIEASTGAAGDIEARLTPLSVDGDLHVSLTTHSGNIRLEIPDDMPADIEARIARSVIRQPDIRSEFPLETVGGFIDLPSDLGNAFAMGTSVGRRGQINGGGNAVRLESARGAIRIQRLRR